MTETRVQRARRNVCSATPLGMSEALDALEAAIRADERERLATNFRTLSVALSGVLPQTEAIKKRRGHLCEAARLLEREK